MKYIWILILLGIDIIWVISFIMNVIHSIKYVKNHKQYYDNIIKVIGYIIDNLDGCSIGFIGAHIGVLFVASFIAWLISFM